MTKRMKTNSRVSLGRNTARRLSADELRLAVGGVKSTSAVGAGRPHGSKADVSSGTDAGRPPGWNASPNSRHKQLLTDMI